MGIESLLLKKYLWCFVLPSKPAIHPITFSNRLHYVFQGRTNCWFHCRSFCTSTGQPNYRDTERKRGDIEQEKVGGLVGGLAGEDGGLDGGTVGDSLVGVDGLVGGTATEEVGDERLDLGDTGGTADKDDVVDLVLGDLGVLKDLLDGEESALEGGGVDLLETGSGDVGLEVGTGEEGVDLDGGLGDGGEGSLGTLAGGTQSAEGTGVAVDVVLGLALELGLEVVEESVVKVLTTKVGVTSGGLDGEDTTSDGQDRDIESTTSEIEDENGALLLVLVVGGVETVGDGGGGGLPLLAEVVDGDVWGAVVVDDLEWPGLHVLLNLSVVEAAADETLCVKDGV